jgi:hypothetical protein
MMREKTGFLSHLYIKVIFFPRQARDKHREGTQNKGVASDRPIHDVEHLAEDGGGVTVLLLQRSDQRILPEALVRGMQTVCVSVHRLRSGGCLGLEAFDFEKKTKTR